MASIRIEGIDNLRRTMKTAGKKLTKMQPTNRAAGDQIARAAGQRAPRQSGTLAGSMVRIRATENAVSIGSRLVYSAVQEFGWPKHHIRGRRFLESAAAETDVTPLYDKYINQVISEIRGA